MNWPRHDSASQQTCDDSLEYEHSINPEIPVSPLYPLDPRPFAGSPGKSDVQLFKAQRSRFNVSVVPLVKPSQAQSSLVKPKEIVL